MAMKMKDPVRELIPSPPQRLSVRIPKGKKVKSVKFLVGASPARYWMVIERSSRNRPFVGSGIRKAKSLPHSFTSGNKVVTMIDDRDSGLH
jgi:hypothetical protein